MPKSQAKGSMDQCTQGLDPECGDHLLSPFVRRSECLYRGRGRARPFRAALGPSRLDFVSPPPHRGGMRIFPLSVAFLPVAFFLAAPAAGQTPNLGKRTAPPEQSLAGIGGG